MQILDLTVIHKLNFNIEPNYDYETLAYRLYTMGKPLDRNELGELIDLLSIDLFMVQESKTKEFTCER